MKIVTSALISLSFATEVLALHIPLDAATSKKLASVSLDNCGPGAEVRLEEGESIDALPAELMVIDFNDLSLQGQRHPTQRVCTVTAKVKVEAGMMLRINSASVIGYSDLTRAQAGSESAVDFSYSMPMTGDEAFASETYAAGVLSDIDLFASMDEPRFSACHNRDQEMDVNGRIQIDLSGPMDELSGVQITGGTQQIGVGWNWGWGDCFSGAFTSNYVAYNGKKYKATFTLDGTDIEYESSAGFTGRLFDLQRKGRVFTGKWAVGNQSGYIEFHISDFAKGRFDGEWGEIDADGRRVFKGKWEGQKTRS